MRYHTLKFTATMLALLAIPVLAAGAETITLQTGKAFIARSNQVQNFVDYIMLKGGQEKLPLTLVLVNGVEGSPRFSWVRASVAGNPVYNSNTFGRSADVRVNISGMVGMDSNQLIIQAGGVPGAKMTWAVESSGLALISASPTEVAPGAQLTLTGSNFGEKVSENIVLFNDKQATVTTASKTQLVALVPDGVTGKTKVTVSRGGITTQPLEVKVKPQPPELTDYVVLGGPPSGPTGHPDGVWSASPTMSIEIHGKNFSKTASENKVTVAGYQAEVTAASPTSLTVTLPEGLDNINPSWNDPIIVETKGQKSKNELHINIQMRVW